MGMAAELLRGTNQHATDAGTPSHLKNYQLLLRCKLPELLKDEERDHM